MSRRAIAIGLLAATVCSAGAAVADEPPAATPKKEALSPEAEVLFTEGRKLFDERNFKEACDKLAESHRLSPSVKALGLLAACHEEQGKLATAYSEYLDAAERAEKIGDPRGKFARKRASDLKPSVPVVQLAVTALEPGLSITQNGKEVPVSPSSELYVDPGPVEIVAVSPGKVPWRMMVTVAANTRISVTIPELLRTAPAAEQAKAPPPQVGSPNPPAAGTPPTRLAGFIIGAAGLSALGVGSGLGFAAIRQNTKSKGEGVCNNENLCTTEGRKLRDGARLYANLSTALFAVGGAGVVTGAVLLLVQPPAKASHAATAIPVGVTVSAAPGAARVWISGSF